MQNVKNSLLSIFRHIRDLTITATFWQMAFAAFLLRLFVARPLSALLALTIGVIWCLGNMPRIREFARAVTIRFTA